MLLKLIRKDVGEGNGQGKDNILEFSVGADGPTGANTVKHVLGRGADNIQSTDKRISRQHASLEIKQDGTTVFTALHVNPCFFYSSKNLTSREILHQNEHKLLQDGDEIALLPDCYRYTVSIQPLTSNGDSPTLVSNSVQRLSDSQSTSVSCTEADKTQIIESNNSKEINELNRSDDDVIAVSPEVKQVDLSDDEAVDFEDVGEPLDEQRDTTNSPSILDKESPGKRKCDVVDDNTEEISAAAAGSGNGQNSKRPRLDAPAENDSPEKKPNIQELLQAIDVVENNNGQAEAGCSGVSSTSDVKQEGGAAGVKKEENNGSTDQSNNAAPVRDKCEYADRCYRRNPQHRVDTSHPGDADWDAPAPCPYGALCYRQNAQHRKLYSHPGAPAQRPQAQPRTKDDKNVTKKRPRKTKPKKETEDWGDSEDEYDEEDPWLAADSSDDYEPSNDEMDEELYEESGNSDQDNGGDNKKKVEGKRKRTISD